MRCKGIWLIEARLGWARLDSTLLGEFRLMLSLPGMCSSHGGFQKCKRERAETRDAYTPSIRNQPTVTPAKANHLQRHGTFSTVRETLQSHSRSWASNSTEWREWRRENNVPTVSANQMLTPKPTLWWHGFIHPKCRWEHLSHRNSVTITWDVLRTKGTIFGIVNSPRLVLFFML